MDPGTGKPRSVRTRIATPFVNPVDQAATGGVNSRPQAAFNLLAFRLVNQRKLKSQSLTRRPARCAPCARIATPFVDGIQGAAMQAAPSQQTGVNFGGAEKSQLSWMQV